MHFEINCRIDAVFLQIETKKKHRVLVKNLASSLAIWYQKYVIKEVDKVQNSGRVKSIDLQSPSLKRPVECRDS